VRRAIQPRESCGIVDPQRIRLAAFAISAIRRPDAGASGVRDEERLGLDRAFRHVLTPPGAPMQSAYPSPRHWQREGAFVQGSSGRCSPRSNKVESNLSAAATWCRAPRRDRPGTVEQFMPSTGPEGATTATATAVAVRGNPRADAIFSHARANLAAAGGASDLYRRSTRTTTRIGTCRRSWDSHRASAGRGACVHIDRLQKNLNAARTSLSIFFFLQKRFT